MPNIARYEVLGELGRGGMGVVLLGYDPLLKRRVAIKSIRMGEVTAGETQEWLERRLFQEAEMAASLKHSGIVAIYDLIHQGNVGYIVMEFVSGTTLAALMRAGDQLDCDLSLRVLRECADALDHAHSCGVVHRDIKPSNIMIGEQGVIKITDFGIAKAITSESMTKSGLVLGTPEYMAPEQILAQPVDGKADQFSLAVIAYEMLTGRKPFAADSFVALSLKILQEQPPSPRGLNQLLNADVDEVLAKGLAKAGSDRYEYCAHFVRALEAALMRGEAWHSTGGRSVQLQTGPVSASREASTRVFVPQTRSDSNRLKEKLQRREIERGISNLGVSAKKAEYGQISEKPKKAWQIFVIAFIMTLTIGMSFRIWREEARLGSDGYLVVFIGCVCMLLLTRWMWRSLARRR